ncbi:hypothetical protein [Planctobacterium marinum]|uniref:hypothetical protein n=1 Tax=Planctobacterium marinum TaxID=1631968 RepID=UPI001E31DB98|nr:hypothetical protein [Planctobacterium marinum]MCC2606775.1 hypothetical protein [Planctobacterium marinum]
MRSANSLNRLTSHAPQFLVWVLLCMVFSASFQTGQVANQAEVTEDSPYAQFSYSGNQYTLRLNSTRLDSNDGDDDSKVALPNNSPVISERFSVHDALLQVTALNVAPLYRHNPRGPPLILT